MHEKYANVLDAFSKLKKLNDAVMEKMMDKYKMRKIDIKLLIYLIDCKDKDTSRDIVELGLFTKGHVSQALSRLTEGGYIYTIKDSLDQRVYHIKLAEKATPIVEDLANETNVIFSKIYAGINEHEKEVMGVVLGKVGNNCVRAINEL